MTTTRLMRRSRKVRQTFKQLRAKYGPAVTLFTACAYLGSVALGKAVE